MRFRMGRLRFSTYLRFKQIVMTFIMCACALSLLLAAAFSSEPVTKSNEGVILGFSDYVSKQLPSRFFNMLYNSTSEPTTVRKVNTTTPTTPVVKVPKDLFRTWFDSRAKVQPYSTTDVHQRMPKILITNNMCNNTEVDILVYFNSACDNHQRRRVLRETWANKNVFKDISVRVMFVLGLPTKPEDQLRINNEKNVYGDIVQGNFIDSFRNLTYKSMIALQWINDNCAHARYIIKADDDMFVNIFMVVEELIPQIYTKSHTVYCHYKKEGTSKIIRDSKAKWYVPSRVLGNRTHFPDFCSGYIVLMTTDVIPVLYKSSFLAPLISIDDVYMFGVLPMFSKKLTYVDGRQYYTLNSKVALDQYKGSQPISLVAANAWPEGAQEDYWAATLSRLTKWATHHANIVMLRKNMGPSTL